MANKKYYVHVTEPEGSEYDIGPFDDVLGFISNDDTAIEWIYKQIGMLKIVTDSSELIKHKWNYTRPESSFADPIVEIDVEMCGYRLVVKTLNAPDNNLVTESLDAGVQ